MIGRLLYHFNRKFRHGLYTAWQRDVARWRILKTPPVYGLTDSTCEIHALTCHSDWIDLIWSLKSFFAVCEDRFRVCIHEDGSVPANGIAALRHHFPEARLIRRDEADALARMKLKCHPRCKALRETNVLSLKVFDFVNFLESDRLLLVDSDVLFFKRPSALLDRINNVNYAWNSLNRDWVFGYTLDSASVQSEVDFSVQTFINSGLGLMHRKSYDINCFEEWLGLPGMLSHPHRIEQTLVALACSRFGHEFLPQEYDVKLERTQPAETVKHYTGPIRHFMYREGLIRVLPLLDFRSSLEDGHSQKRSSRSPNQAASKVERPSNNVQ